MRKSLESISPWAKHFQKIFSKVLDSWGVTITLMNVGAGNPAGSRSEMKCQICEKQVEKLALKEGAEMCRVCAWEELVQELEAVK